MTRMSWLPGDRYTEGLCEDGAAILCEGQPITISEILKRLNAGDELSWLAGFEAGKEAAGKACEEHSRINIVAATTRSKSMGAMLAFSGLEHQDTAAVIRALAPPEQQP